MNLEHFSMLSLVEYQKRFETCGYMDENGYDFQWALVYAKPGIARYLISKNEHNHVRYSGFSFIGAVLLTIKNEDYKYALLKIIVEAGIDPNTDLLKERSDERVLKEFFMVNFVLKLSPRILELLLNHGLDVNMEGVNHNMLSRLFSMFCDPYAFIYNDDISKQGVREMIRILIENGISLEKTLSFYTPNKIYGWNIDQVRLLESIFFEYNPSRKRLNNRLYHGPSILNSKNK